MANSFLTDNYIEAYYKLKLISSPQQTLRWLGTGSRLRTQQAANDILQMNNTLQPFAEMSHAVQISEEKNRNKQSTSQYNQNPWSRWEQYSIVKHFLPFPGKIYSRVWVLLSLFCSLRCQAAGKLKSLVQVKCDHKRQWYQDLSETHSTGFEGKSEFHT